MKVNFIFAIDTQKFLFQDPKTFQIILWEKDSTIVYKLIKSHAGTWWQGIRSRHCMLRDHCRKGQELPSYDTIHSVILLHCKTSCMIFCYLRLPGWFSGHSSHVWALRCIFKVTIITIKNQTACLQLVKKLLKNCCNCENIYNVNGFVKKWIMKYVTCIKINYIILLYLLYGGCG